MSVRKVLICAAALLSLPVIAKPVQFICDKNNFTIYGNSSETKYAVIINNELAENTNIDEFPYGDSGDSIVVSFDVWGANGGMHNHYITIFPKNGSGIKQVVQWLDADNRPRGDTITKKCNMIKNS